MLLFADELTIRAHARRIVPTWWWRSWDIMRGLLLCVYCLRRWNWCASSSSNWNVKYRSILKRKLSWPPQIPIGLRFRITLGKLYSLKHCSYEPEDALEWALVLDEIKGFIKADQAVSVLHADSNPIVLTHRWAECWIECGKKRCRVAWCLLHTIYYDTIQATHDIRLT